jgi:hypothetical protein
MSENSESQGDVDGWEKRAHRAAKDVEAKRHVLEAAIVQRDRLLIEGVDRGVKLSKVGATMLLSAARIQQILAAKG